MMSEGDWYQRFLLMVRATARILDEACATRPADLEQVELLKEMSFRFFEPMFPA